MHVSSLSVENDTMCSYCQATARWCQLAGAVVSSLNLTPYASYCHTTVTVVWGLFTCIHHTARHAQASGHHPPGGQWAQPAPWQQPPWPCAPP